MGITAWKLLLMPLWAVNTSTATRRKVIKVAGQQAELLGKNQGDLISLSSGVFEKITAASIYKGWR